MRTTLGRTQRQPPMPHGSTTTRILTLIIASALLVCGCAYGATPTPVPTPSNTAAPPTATPTPLAIGPAVASQGQHSLFIEPDDGRTALVSAIHGARSSVSMKMYQLGDRAILDELKQAANRGVRVRVMLEHDPYGNGPGNQTAYDMLLAMGGQVRWSNPALLLTHEKSVVIDEQTAFIMTLDMINASFVYNREYGIITKQPAEVQEVLRCFNADWDRTPFVPDAGSAIVWSTENSRQTILSLIDSAHKTLILEQEETQDREILQHLVLAAKRGVAVRVLAAGPQDPSQLDLNAPGQKQLRDGGVAVRTIISPVMHAKMYLVDGNRALIGSMNISTASLNNNRELGILIADPAIIERISDTFERDWLKGKSVR
jgi:cardiolipin synthase